MVDDIDRRLVAALLADGRGSVSDVANAAGVSTSTATKRLRELEEEGVIEGYHAEVDYAALGYEMTAVFRLDVAGDGLADVVADLREADQMVGVYEVTGSDDVVAIGKFADSADLNAQIRELLTREHVRSASTDVVLDTVCEHDPPPVGPDE
ncbi:MAG: winged helix-turn-helix transcriptional regulator [Haloarculaceae archaeon]